MSLTAIILAGGFGTRLSKVVAGVPKPMAPVRNRPFLDYQLSWLSKNGCKNAILCTGYLAETISEHYGNRFRDMSIDYSVEKEPLGTGGAVKKAFDQRDDNEVLVVNGDSMFEIDLTLLMDLHGTHRAECSVALRHVADTSRYGSIDIDSSNRVVAFREKTQAGGPGLINGGIYLLNRQAFLRHAPSAANFSLENDFFTKKTDTMKLHGFVFDSYFIDIGIPSDYDRAQHEFERFEDR